MLKGEDLEKELWTSRIRSEEERMWPRLVVSYRAQLKNGTIVGCVAAVLDASKGQGVGGRRRADRDSLHGLHARSEVAQVI